MSYKFAFDHIRHPNVVGADLYRGITDFGALEQFNLFDSGRSFFVILDIPEFLTKLKEKSNAAEQLIDNAIYIMENEFKGLDGIEDISSDTIEITDGISSVNVINKVNEQSASTISMSYTEKKGTVLTHFIELYLTGIYDPRSSFTHYHGIIEEDSNFDADFENEVFTSLYFVTDRTGLNIEKAFIFLCGQIPTAPTNIYNSARGDHSEKEITIEMNCFPIKGPEITLFAKEMLEALNIQKNYNHYEYTGGAAHDYTVASIANRGKN